MKKTIYPLLGFILLCLIVELIGGWFTRLSVMTWYPTLIKPFGTPPGWVFGPVWTSLYVMMAVAAWLIWREHQQNKVPLYFWGVQLGLNLIWSLLFFTLQNPLLGMIDIFLLWIVLIATTVLFWKIHRMAGALMLPYVAWVTYAAYLNISIWFLN